MASAIITTDAGYVVAGRVFATVEAAARWVKFLESYGAHLARG